MKKILLSFWLLCFQITLTSYSQTFKKCPYLLHPGSNTQMTVVWQLSGSAGSVISWGLTQVYGNYQAITEYGTDHQFKFDITGLNPATKYYYKVESGGIVQTGSFRTAPSDMEDNISFYIYGDTRSHPEVQNNVTGRILAEIENDTLSQTFCLFTGDAVKHGRVENDWQNQFFNSSYANSESLKSMMPFILARGNHENYNSSYNSGYATVFYKYWPYNYASGSTNGDDMYYSFDYGPVHIAVVDQYDNGSFDPAKLSSTQLNWLQNDLANSDKNWKFILLHEPGWSAKYTSKSEHGNNSDVQNNIQPLCIQYGVQAVFGGHNHYYAHCLVDGVHHFTLGGGGAPLYDPSHTSGGVIVYAESTYHFMKVTIQNDNATLTAIRPDGSTVETVNLSIPVSVADMNNDEDIRLFPNPTNGKFVIKTNNSLNGSVTVKNILGETLFITKILSRETQIDLSLYKNGLYFIQIEMNHKTYFKRIIKY